MKKRYIQIFSDGSVSLQFNSSIKNIIIQVFEEDYKEKNLLRKNNSEKYKDLLKYKNKYLP